MKKEDKLIDDLIPMIKDLIEQQSDYLENLKEEIDNIIKYNLINEHKIETLLDQLLSLIQTDRVVNLYKKLCRYYYSINKKKALDYAKIYLEMYPEEKVNIKKRLKKNNNYGDLL